MESDLDLLLQKVRQFTNGTKSPKPLQSGMLHECQQSDPIYSEEIESEEIEEIKDITVAKKVKQRRQSSQMDAIWQKLNV